ncbi:MAG: bacteriohemerythrin [Acidobacteriota bacterium]
MALIEWTPALELGVEQMDRQHRQLVRILNELHQAMLAGSQPRDLMRVMEELLLYTKYHFTTEERLMAEAGYPGRKGHRREHQGLTARVEEYADQVLKGRASVSLSVLQFLKEWINGHLLGADREFAEFVKARSRAA